MQHVESPPVSTIPGAISTVVAQLELSAYICGGRRIGTGVLLVAIAIKKIEDGRKHQRHHASMVGIDLQIFEIEVVRDHPVPHCVAALYRRQSQRPLRHHDRHLLDAIPRIIRFIDERT